MSDARWKLIEPTLTAWRAAGRGPGAAMRVHDLREIVNAIRCVCGPDRTGVPAARRPAVQDGLRLLRQVGRRWYNGNAA
ncbi:hypothetical protein ALI144C_00395 [Actinosynnema sp. ALI-1.44]|nr:hypothetical protein ALI144C_00395 [Actinosynnema sp. ALI-1.44]